MIGIFVGTSGSFGMAIFFPSLPNPTYPLASLPKWSGREGIVLSSPPYRNSRAGGRSSRGLSSDAHLPYVCKVQIGSEEEHDEQTSATFSRVVMTIC